MLSKEKVNELLLKAKEKDRELKIFGADSHKYMLNPPTTREKVQEFEAKYGLKLPKEYVHFLTEIGNGGAGPDYGLYSLEKVEKYNSEQLGQVPGAKPFINDHMDVDYWNEETDESLEDDEKYDERYDEFLNHLYTGMLIIGTQGCTLDTILMCSGSESGKIVYIDWNLEPGYPPHLTEMTFEEWYVGFFEEIISGNSVRRYGWKYCMKA